MIYEVSISKNEKQFKCYNRSLHIQTVQQGCAKVKFLRAVNWTEYVGGF